MTFKALHPGLGSSGRTAPLVATSLVEYIDVQGPGVVTYSGDGRGIDDTPFAGASNHTFSHLAIHDWESAVYTAGMSRPTFEWLDVYDIMAVNWSTFHPNGIFTNSAPNGIVRYSRFHRGPKGNGMGEGIFFEQSGGSTGWLIYGNVFYDLNSEGWKSIEITSNVGPIKIYNNTFDNTGVPGVYVNAGSCGSGSESRNNLGFQTSFDSCGTNSNNLVTSSTSVWVNRNARDYHIVGTVGTGFPHNAGTNLSSVFTTDPDGVVYGADGTWDVGAYELAGGGSAPSAPTNLRIVP